MCVKILVQKKKWNGHGQSWFKLHSHAIIKKKSRMFFFSWVDCTYSLFSLKNLFTPVLVIITALPSILHSMICL